MSEVGVFRVFFVCDSSLCVIFLVAEWEKRWSKSLQPRKEGKEKNTE